MKHLNDAGRAPQDVLDELRGFAVGDPNYRDGRLWSLVYHLDEAHAAFLSEAYAAFSAANGLNPTAFKSLKRFENDIIASVAEGSSSASARWSPKASCRGGSGRGRRCRPRAGWPAILASAGSR